MSKQLSHKEEWSNCHSNSGQCLVVGWFCLLLALVFEYFLELPPYIEVLQKKLQEKVDSCQIVWSVVCIPELVLGRNWSSPCTEACMMPCSLGLGWIFKSLLQNSVLIKPRSLNMWYPVLNNVPPIKRLFKKTEIDIRLDFVCCLNWTWSHHLPANNLQ